MYGFLQQVRFIVFQTLKVSKETLERLRVKVHAPLSQDVKSDRAPSMLEDIFTGPKRYFKLIMKFDFCLLNSA